MAGDSFVNKLAYNEAKELINLAIIDYNHRVLENASRKVEDSALLCENPEIQLNQTRTEIFFIRPDFLDAPQEKRHKILKRNIELYINGFENLSKKLNEFIKNISKGLNNLNKPSIELKLEINKILSQFEDTTKRLCAPLISQSEGLNTIDQTTLTEEQNKELELDKNMIEEGIFKFSNEAEKLNKNYNKIFLQILKSIETICNAIDEIPKPVMELQNELEDAMTKFEEFLENITDENKDENFDNQLNEIRDFFKAIKSKAEKIEANASKKCQILDKQYQSGNKLFSDMKVKVKESIAKLEYESEKIKFDIIKIREKYKQKKIELPEMKLSEIIIDIVYNKIDETIEKEKNEFTIFVEIPKSDPPKIEMDLLYIMDITGSMEGYVNATKVGLIDIMENIIKCCNEMVNINLGFIGYRDVGEIRANDYVDIDFTKDHFEVKEKIKKIVVGGGDDTAEDVAFAFERAVDKKWSKDSIKFAILVCDAPCHGKEYHDENLIDDYSVGVPGREKIENSVAKLRDMNVSLFCVKLKKDTDIMYKKIEDIYKNRNIDKCQFFMAQLDDPKKLADIIVKKSSYAVQNFV